MFTDEEIDGWLKRASIRDTDPFAVQGARIVAWLRTMGEFRPVDASTPRDGTPVLVAKDAEGPALARFDAAIRGWETMTLNPYGFVFPITQWAPVRLTKLRRT